jgi:hypothetical protein
MNIETTIREAFQHKPQIDGPIPVTESSHPFCAMKYSRTPLDVAAYGYAEEEYFLSGFANVYDADAFDRPVLRRAALPYKNRVLVRRPVDPARFSGRVYVDILNATQGYDIEDLWHRNYQWCMAHGHAYVGVTSKPVNVLSLKNFDYARYGTLNWSNGELLPAPVLSKSATIPGTEEGLLWDMLGQLGTLLRAREGSPCLGGQTAQYLYLTGQSQSGAYLNTFIHYFDPFSFAKNNERIFNGYMNIVGALVQRSIRQSDEVGCLKLHKRNMRPCGVPYVCLSSEADLFLFNAFLDDDLFRVKVQNVDEPDNKCRYYEIAGTPHTDILCPVLTSPSEIEKAGGRLPNLNPKLIDDIDDIPMEYYVCGLLDKLHLWAATGKAPEEIEPLRRDGRNFQRDDFGNAVGGLRTPYVDVPIASYVASNPEDPEGICGKMTYFTRQQFGQRYGTTEWYWRQFEEYTHRQAKEGWIDADAAAAMIRWSREAVHHLR